MATNKRRALIVDDDPNMQDLVTSILEEGNFECQVADTATEAYRIVGEGQFDLLVIDRKLPDTDGTRLLQQMRGVGVTAPAIVITAYPSVDTAADALRWGAYDYLVKPFDARELLAKAQAAISEQSLVDENVYLWGALEQKYGWQHVLSRNSKVQRTYVMAAKAARSDAPVLIQGETGTGKEYLARAIHEKGAFTSANTAKAGLCEIADGGTLFLDEITHMSAAMQVKLLRFVEDHSFMRLGGTKPVAVDVRIIAASNQPIDGMVASSQFREDLYYRLNVIPLTLPPLRERPEDIEVFTEHFIKQFSGGADKRISQEAWEKLYSHNWPGNLRELRNTVQRAVVLSVGDTIRPEHLLIDTELVGPANRSNGSTKQQTS